MRDRAENEAVALWGRVGIAQNAARRLVVVRRALNGDVDRAQRVDLVVGEVTAVGAPRGRGRAEAKSNEGGPQLRRKVGHTLVDLSTIDNVVSVGLDDGVVAVLPQAGLGGFERSVDADGETQTAERVSV